MYEIYHTDTHERAAIVQMIPFTFTKTAAAGPAVDAALDMAEDLQQMNRTKTNEQPAFPAAEGPTGNKPSSMEGYQDPSADFRADFIPEAVEPGYQMREVTGQDRAEAMRRLAAAADFSEGSKVEFDGQEGVVVEVWTSGEREGPDGETYQASDDSPVYIVATADGAVAVPGDALSSSDWGSDVDSPDQDLSDSVEASAPDGDADIEASVTDWDYPDSWDESSTPNRLILLDAWSSMGGQFDCGGGCCKGTMMSGGMPEGAANAFCASMKDRVLLWEGWRQGG